MIENYQEELDGAKLVAGAILGLDYRYAIVNDKAYIISPPTIAKMAGAAYWLSDLSEGETVRDILSNFKNYESLAKALSFLIQGDDSLTEELSKATPKEVIDGIETAFTLIGVENFIKLSALLRSARVLIAKQK